MGRTVKTMLGAAAVAGLLAGAMPGQTYAAKRKPKKFTASGTVAGVGVVTHENFIVSCPEPPPTQGVDAYVVEVPMEFGAKPSEVVVEATAVTAEPTIELSFYGYGCDQGELYVGAPTTVPPGTGFIIVQDLQGGNVDFELTLTQR
ncbi:MAG TPA: hypothetical protein VHJ76_02790 [Actinomycetota bacterium]|nr:hypothetical protein [Actinomycetota bacterium]